MTRWPALVLIVALIAAAIALGAPERDRDAATPTEAATLLPVASPEDALGSLWFCPGQSAGDDTTADGTLVVANAGQGPAVGRVELVSDDGETASLDIEVAPDTTERIALSDHVEADWVAATVELDAGAVAVEREVVGADGRAVAPCHTRSSDVWHLASGSTTRDAQMLIAVYNPNPDSATVDMSFATDAGARRPNDLQGLPVAARSLLIVDVTPIVTIRADIAATVTARRGRVVVDRIQTFDGRGASTTDEDAAAETYRPKGITVTPATPTPRPVWVFPAGVRSPGVHETISVFNPGETQATVEIDVALNDPRRNGRLDPFPLVVPPGELETFEVDEADAIPEGVTHSLTVRVTDGSPVVAERRLVAAGDTVTYTDVATSTGSPLAAPAWIFASGRRDPEVEIGRIVVVNPGDEEVAVEVTALDGGERRPVPGGRLTLAAGARVELDLAELDGDLLSLLVEADGPVVAERRLISRPTGGEDDPEPGVGASTAIGVPLADGLVALDR